MKRYFLLALLFSGTLKAQIKNLVFEGAGIRGIAYCGAIKELEQNGLLQNIERVGGTSAGAVTALAISLGYTADEIAELINSTSFKKFNDGRYFFFGGTLRLKKYYGWYRGAKFDKWLSAIIKKKTGNGGITFKKMHERKYKDLFVTGTSLDQQKLFVFSFEQYPQMKIKDAVRISMSIPLYFEAVFMDVTGQTFFHPKNKQGLHIMVDGGFIANFPISLFDSTKYQAPSRANEFFINEETLGFRIDSDEQIKNDATSKGLTAMDVSSFNKYLTAFYTIILENLNRQLLTENDWKRTISISDGGMGPRIKKISLSQKEILIQNGQKATANYLKSRKSTD